MPRFGCPSVELGLGALLERARRALWPALVGALALHGALTRQSS